jgi:GR25 family glycosyltransferase involved in LPS biosynthesis
MTARIKVLIVTVPNCNRVLPLESELNIAQNIEVIKFDAIMYHRQIENFQPNFKKQRILYSKELSNGEIGCAISHQNIQARYKDYEESIVVLEDDARILDIELFEKLAREFIHKHQGSDAVMSLLAWNHSVNVDKEKKDDHKIVRLVGRTPLTVGYVITPSAMRSLSKANADFAYLPDWPPTQTKFYITRSGVIEHGDGITESLIDKTGRKKPNRLNSLFKFTMIPYLMNRKQFSGISEYLRFAFIPAFTWRIDRFRLG